MTEQFYADPKLLDHTRHKKRLAAPWGALRRDSRMVMSSWELTRLPEIIWIGELIFSMGCDASLRALTVLFRCCREAAKPQQVVCPPLASYWQAHATQETKAHCLEGLRMEGLLAAAQKALSVLIALYPDYPVAFLVGSSRRRRATASEVADFKARLKILYNRFTAEAVRIHVHIHLAEVESGFLQVPSEMNLPDVHMVYATDVDPTSDEFNNVAGMVRSGFMSLLAHYTTHAELTAARYFWNRGLELEPCA